MNKLTLPLKTKWFEMTDPDGKTEDYRELTPYWWSRLAISADIWKIDDLDESGRILLPPNEWKLLLPKLFDFNVMTLGYPKSTDKSRIKIFEHAGIEIRTGNPEWGAELDKLYFVIKHGRRIQ